MPVSDMRDRATQDEIFSQTVRRLRSQVKGLNESNCIVTDQEQPPTWPSGSVVCTVCSGPGKFPEALYAGGGISTLCEVASLKVSIWVRCKLDKPPTAEAPLLGSDKGLISKYKPAILRALLSDEKNGAAVPWEPCDEDGVKLLRNQLSPISCTAPTPTSDGEFLGITLAFDTTFDWRL
jgi:hypothetical protein